MEAVAGAESLLVRSGAQPTAEDLVRAMEEAVPRVPHVDCAQFHQRVRAMYSWENVAERTERVYERIYKQPKLPLIERFRRYGPLNYRTAARTLLLRPYLAHFCSFFRRFFRCSLRLDARIPESGTKRPGAGSATVRNGR